MDHLPDSWASTPRSRNVMRGNRSRDTRPELAVRSALHRMGLRFRVDARPLPELRRKADIIFPRARVAVFIDGCFWHGCPEHYVRSKSNVEYWTSKIASNKERDVDTDSHLIASDWMPIRVWAHEDVVETSARIAEIVVRRSGIAD
jgi:DNA mismatch endonuclease (patch repair protein)